MEDASRETPVSQLSDVDGKGPPRCKCPSGIGFNFASSTLAQCETCGHALCDFCGHGPCSVCGKVRCPGNPCGGVVTACDACDENVCVRCLCPREAHLHSEDEFIKDLPADEVQTGPGLTCVRCGCHCAAWRVAVDRRAGMTKQCARRSVGQRAPRRQAGSYMTYNG